MIKIEQKHNSPEELFNHYKRLLTNDYNDFYSRLVSFKKKYKAEVSITGNDMEITQKPRVTHSEDNEKFKTSTRMGGEFSGLKRKYRQLRIIEKLCHINLNIFELKNTYIDSSYFMSKLSLEIFNQAPSNKALNTYFQENKKPYESIELFNSIEKIYFYEHNKIKVIDLVKNDLLIPNYIIKNSYKFNPDCLKDYKYKEIKPFLDHPVITEKEILIHNAIKEIHQENPKKIKINSL